MVKAAERLSRREWRHGSERRCLERLRSSDPEALAVISLVADRSGIDAVDLLRNSRSQAHIAAARQLAMYLVNVKLGRTMTDIGALFGRDRTTVSHACRVIEDRREGAFDREVDQLELMIDGFAGRSESALEASHAIAC